MAESYIIIIKFTPNQASVKDTERKLNNVFTRCARNFKNAISKAWKGVTWGAVLPWRQRLLLPCLAK